MPLITRGIGIFMYTEAQMAKIVADLITDGQVVNLGIGMPTLVANEL